APGTWGGPSQAGFVLGDSQPALVALLLDEIHDPAQAPAAGEHDLVPDAPLVHARPTRQSERQLEGERLPLRLHLHRLLEPGAQVDAQRRHLVLPDAGDRGRELLVILESNACQRLFENIERGAKRFAGQGQAAALLERAQALGLDLVEDAAAREWIEPLERRDLLAWREPPDRREVELVRTGREPLERRDRIRARVRPRREQHVARPRRE